MNFRHDSITSVEEKDMPQKPTQKENGVPLQTGLHLNQATINQGNLLQHLVRPLG